MAEPDNRVMPSESRQTVYPLHSGERLHLPSLNQRLGRTEEEFKKLSSEQREQLLSRLINTVKAL